MNTHTDLMTPSQIIYEILKMMALWIWFYQLTIQYLSLRSSDFYILSTTIFSTLLIVMPINTLNIEIDKYSDNLKMHLFLILSLFSSMIISLYIILDISLTILQK